MAYFVRGAGQESGEKERMKPKFPKVKDYLPITGHYEQGIAGDWNETLHLGENSEVPKKHPSKGRRHSNTEAGKRSRKK